MSVAPAAELSDLEASGPGLRPPGAAAVRRLLLLDEYQSGHVQPLVLAFSTATRIAAAEARVTADRVVELPDGWREALGPVRTGSATDRLLSRLPDLAAFTAEDAHDELDDLGARIERHARRQRGLDG